MKFNLSISCIVAIILLQGCSHTPPRTENLISSATAVAIVEKIQCEAGKAIKIFDAASDFDAAIITNQVDFTITEKNDTSSTFTLSFPIISSDTLTLTFGGNHKLAREGDRQIKITNSFSELRKLAKNGCNKEFKGHLQSYPILGTIGLDEVIGSFVDLVKLDPDNKKGHEFINIYQDVVTFTTELDGNLSPKVEIKKATGETLTTDLGQTNSRKDIHKLTVFITPPETKSVNEIKKALKDVGQTLNEAILDLKRVNDVLTEEFSTEWLEVENKKQSLEKKIQDLTKTRMALIEDLDSRDKSTFGLALGAVEAMEPSGEIDEDLVDAKRRASEAFERNRSGNILNQVIQDQRE